MSHRDLGYEYTCDLCNKVEITSSRPSEWARFKVHTVWGICREDFLHACKDCWPLSEKPEVKKTLLQKLKSRWINPAPSTTEKE